MLRARLIVVLIASLLLPAQASAQDEWEQQVLEQIESVSTVFAADGYALHGDARTGALGSTASESFSLILESGFDYMLVGACDIDCTDIDLMLFDEAGNEVDRDYEEDDAPVLMVEPSRTQSYSVHVYMADCSNEPCWYAVGVFARRTGAETAVASSSATRYEIGYLAAGDETLESGEYYEVYSLSGTAGDYVVIDLQSSDFDPYLILAAPSGAHFENDDYEGDASRSRLAMELPESGDYVIAVTSYEAGETGAYELSMDLGAATGASASTAPEVVELAVGQNAGGRLEAGDGRLETGEYVDVYTFEGHSGQNVEIEMTSSEFDTYLVLMTPGEDQIDNDDFDGQTNRSRIEIALRETGRYSIAATSYKADETGAYELALSPGTAAAAATTAAAAGGGGRIYGVFAGISDYPGEADDLAYTAQDARDVHDALTRVGMRPQDAVVLTDEAATIGGVHGAFRTLSERMGPGDTFVFFYSGHGNRLPRADYQPADPDAMDETIELYDGPITDDEMSDMLAGIGAGTSIVVLDACFSGGFSKDVISVPGRMGFFSSEEDVTSSVAAKFRAGGYLAAFLADAVGDGLADGDDDGGVSALELSQYLHERYRADVKSTGSSEIVRTGGPQLGYQHLVVDRGSINPYDVLFYFQAR